MNQKPEDDGADFSLDATDKKLVTMIQADFPITDRPFAAIGKKLGISEEEVIRRIQAIMDSGEIRRLGASFDSRKLGYTSTLCAVHVPPEKLKAAVGC